MNRYRSQSPSHCIHHIWALALRYTQVAFAAVIVSLGSCTWVAAEPQAPQASQAPRGAIERVTAGNPVRKTLAITTTQPGWIHAFEEAPLQPRVMGYVKSVNADIGDEVVAANALIDVANANLARARTMVGYTEMKAPFKGIITQRNVDTGHSVSPQETNRLPLLVIARHDVVRVFTQVPELEAEWVTAANAKTNAIADSASVTIQGLSHRTFETSVTRTAWALDPQNRTLRTELDIDNPEGTLRPGMYATVQIKLEERVNALSLPVTAIVREGGITTCCAVVDGKIAFRPIGLGIRGGDDVEVLCGIREDEVIVLTRAGSLREGQAVEVLPPVAK